MIESTTSPARTYSARERAAKNGVGNPTEDRAERELRAGIVETHGRPAFYRCDDDGAPRVLTKLSAPFFASLLHRKRDVLWEPEEARFYAYDAATGLWRVQTEERLLSDVHGFMLSESRRKEIITGAPAMAVGMEEKLSWKLEQEVVERLKAEAELRGAFKRGTDFAHGERCIHFANGVFVLRDGKPAGFRDGFDKLHYSRNRCPVAYDPAAECPRTMNEFLLPALHEESAEADRDLLFAFLGFALLGFNVLQKILVLQGAGQSGKSTFAKLAALIVGEENAAQLRTHLLGERFEQGSFIGRTLLLGADVNPKFFLSPGAEVLKALTGGDLLQAELKQGNARPTFYGTFNVMVTTNDELRIKLQGDRDAWARRLVVVPFRYHEPARRIRDYQRELLREEGPGIVNYALALALACLERGKLPLNAVQQRRIDDMLDRSDPVREFVSEKVIAFDGKALTKKELRERFKEECKARRWSVPGDREIGSRLPAIMKELFAVDESHSVPDFAGGPVQGYRGVDWRKD